MRTDRNIRGGVVAGSYHWRHRALGSLAVDLRWFSYAGFHGLDLSNWAPLGYRFGLNLGVLSCS